MSEPGTPQEIREILIADPASVTDPLLLALTLGQGGVIRGAGGKTKKKWTAVQLAAALFDRVGGQLADLVQRVHDETIDPRAEFGVGKVAGSRLIATTELAWRLRRGLRDGGDAEIRGSLDSLARNVFARQHRPTEGEIVFLLVGRHWPERDVASQLLGTYESPQQLVTELDLSSFELGTTEYKKVMRLTGTEIDLQSGSCFRLIAGLELARRYYAQTGVSALDDLELPAAASGLLTAEDLVAVTDPSLPLARETRQRLADAVRTDPRLTADLGQLRSLLESSRAANFREAIELHKMFELLLRQSDWVDPAEVVGNPVPFRGLLAIAEARTAETRDPAAIRHLEEGLRKAEREAAERPLASFVDALLDLRLSDTGAAEVFEEANRRYRTAGESLG